MPGIAAVLGPGAGVCSYERALSVLRQPGHHAATLLEPTPNAVIAFAAYDGYPMAVERSGDSWAIIEGALYAPARKECSTRITQLLRAYQRDPAGGRREAELWAATVDGDFIVLLYAPAIARLLVLSDSLGRLTLFVRRLGRSVALAREVKFLANLAQLPLPDKLACAQTLLFGWPLDNRTLLEGIACLPPATSVEIDLVTGAIDQRQYHAWSLEELRRMRPMGTSAESVAAALVGACKAQAEWAADRPVLLSLSGGLDSRAVAAGFAKSGAAQASTAVTFRDAAGEYESDVETAKKVAAALELPWRLVELQAPTPADWRRLVDLRAGLNYIGAAHVLRFVEKLRTAFGSEACYVTGDGGDRILQDLSPRRRLRTFDDLVEYRLADCIWPPATAATLAGVSESELVESVRAVLERYPESSMVLREMHFSIIERGLRYFLEGEERNRMLMWSMAPLWSQSLFRLAMAVPARQKRGFRFYAAVLRALAPGVAALPYANLGAALGSPRATLHALLRRVYHAMPESIRRSARRHVLRYAYDAPPRADLKDLVATLAADRSLLATLGRSGSLPVPVETCSQLQLNVLATVMLYFEQRGAAYVTQLNRPAAHDLVAQRT